MTEEQDERFVAAFEQIATALTGIHDTQEKQFAKQWPERREVHEAIYSRVPTEDDLIREEQGGSAGSTEEWLTLPEEEEYIGQREREFIAAAARTKTAEEGRSESSSLEAPEDQTGDAGIGASDYPAL